MKRIFSYIVISFCVVYLIIFSCLQVQRKDKLTTINVWYMPNATEAKDPPSDWHVYKRLRDELGIELQLKRLPSSAVDNSAFILDAAKNDSLPDFFKCNHATLEELVKMDKVEECSGLFQLMPERSKILYTNNSIKSSVFNKKIYGLAQIGSIPKNEGLVIRKDWLDRLGLPVPKTLDEFYDVMYAFTYNDPDGNGKNDTYGYGAFIECTSYEDGLGKRFAPLLAAFGCETVLGKDHKINIRNDRYFEAISFINKMAQTGVIDPFWYSYKKEEFRNSWKVGRVGCMREQFAALARKDNYDLFDKNFPNGEWIVIDPPVGPYGDSAVGIEVSSYSIWAVKKGLDKKKLSKLIEMLEWMSTDAFEEIVFGIEGTNFIRKNGEISDDVFDKTKAYSSKEFARYRQLMNLVSDFRGPILRSQYPSFTSRSGRNIDCLEYLSQMQTKKFSSADALPDIPKDLRHFYQSKMQSFIVNPKTLSKSEWDKFVSDFLKNGGLEWEERVKYQM